MFKVGEMVSVYIGRDRRLGEVESIVDDHEIIVRFSGDGYAVSVSPKQCRRLVKKPRRRVWITKSQLENMEKDEAKLWVFTNSNYLTCQEGDQLIEFIEVRKTK